MLSTLSSTTRVLCNTCYLNYTLDCSYDDQIYHNASNHNTDNTCTHDCSYNGQTYHNASNHHADYTCTHDCSYNDQTNHNAYNYGTDNNDNHKANYSSNHTYYNRLHSADEGFSIEISHIL
ncbi:uncharacterized protein [Haliotis asinina]|uniref:uncharacterized protein n=1 Tax=Haliotis asinina TaxID=109174 RepID=UPI003531A473